MIQVRHVVLVLLAVAVPLACSPLRYFPSDKVEADTRRDPMESYRMIESMVQRLPPGGGQVDLVSFSCSMFVMGSGAKTLGGTMHKVNIMFKKLAFRDVKSIEVGGVLGSYLLIVITEDGEYHDCWAGDPMYSKLPVPDDYDEVLARLGAAILEYAHHVRNRL